MHQCGRYWAASNSSYNSDFDHGEEAQLEQVWSIHIKDIAIEEAKKYQDSVENRLALSDKVVNGDLLRFYTPENFIPVDRTQYNYNEPQDNESDE